MLAVLFRPRPLSNHDAAAIANAVRRGNSRLKGTPAWRASVHDEVCETMDGALLRRIKILITDGPRFESDKPAWG